MEGLARGPCVATASVLCLGPRKPAPAKHPPARGVGRLRAGTGAEGGE
jgi:hypothetical protein